MSGNGANRPLGYTLDERDKWGRRFLQPCECFLTNTDPWMLSFLSVDQWFNECTGDRNGNSCASSRTESFFVLNLSLFIRPIAVDFFNLVLSFSEANFWTTLASFSKLSFGEIALWTLTVVWLLLVSLRATFLVEVWVRWFPLASESQD